VAEQVVVRKCDKYADIFSTYTFLPIASETLGPMNDLAYCFLAELGRRTSDVSGIFVCLSPFSGSMQHISVKRSPGTMIRTTSHSAFDFSLFLVFNPWDLYYQGYKK